MRIAIAGVDCTVTEGEGEGASHNQSAPEAAGASAAEEWREGERSAGVSHVVSVRGVC
jgi:hypothetical protein